MAFKIFERFVFKLSNWFLYYYVYRHIVLYLYGMKANFFINCFTLANGVKWGDEGIDSAWFYDCEYNNV